MRLTIYRDRCWHQLSACEECFADFLRTGKTPTRGCMSPVVDDGAPEMVVKVVSGEQVGTLVITERNRERIIYEGWTKFVRLAKAAPQPNTHDRAEPPKHDES
jgi:hypothetical protein